jgi:hypothetical protein
MKVYPPLLIGKKKIFSLERGSSQLNTMHGLIWPLQIFVQSSLIEDYVLTLKTLVRLKALVEGLGICKGKKTGLSVDYVKSTQVVPVHIEILVGKSLKCIHLHK